MTTAQATLSKEDELKQLAIRLRNDLDTMTAANDLLQNQSTALADELQEIRHDRDNYINRTQLLVNAMDICPACGMNPPIHSMRCWIFRFTDNG